MTNDNNNDNNEGINRETIRGAHEFLYRRPTALANIGRKLGARNVGGMDYTGLAKKIVAPLTVLGIAGLALWYSLTGGNKLIADISVPNQPPVTQPVVTQPVSAGYDAGKENESDVTTLEAKVDEAVINPSSEQIELIELIELTEPKFTVPELEPAVTLPFPELLPERCTYSNDGLRVSFIVEESAHADLASCGYTAAEATRIVAYTAVESPNYRLRKGKGPQKKYKFLEVRIGGKWRKVRDSEGSRTGDAIDLLLPPDLRSHVGFKVVKSPYADLVNRFGYENEEAMRILNHTTAERSDEYRLTRGIRHTYLERNSGRGWQRIDTGDTINLLIPTDIKKN